MWVREEKMNVFVKEWAHQSVVAWCLHQCVQGTPHQSITQEAPSSFQEKKDFTVKFYRESLASKEVVLGTLQVPRGEEKEGREQNAIESL